MKYIKKKRKVVTNTKPNIFSHAIFLTILQKRSILGKKNARKINAVYQQ